MKNFSAVCPVSEERVNENVVRAIAFFVSVLTVAGILTQNYFVFILLAFDFAVRAFTPGRASVLKFAGKQLVKKINAGNKPVNAAPKKFAAALGLLFSLMILFLQVGHFFIASEIGAGLLVSCALLESFAGICIGCRVHSLLANLT